MNAYDYILKRTHIPMCNEQHLSGGMCGTCFWAGITIPVVPECTVCKDDTERFGKLVKENPKAKNYDFEPNCFKACIWWEWFHSVRKNKCGCLCKDICSCGKINYVEKKKVVKELVKEMKKMKI